MDVLLGPGAKSRVQMDALLSAGAKSRMHIWMRFWVQGPRVGREKGSSMSWCTHTHLPELLASLCFGSAIKLSMCTADGPSASTCGSRAA